MSLTPQRSFSYSTIAVLDLNSLEDDTATHRGIYANDNRCNN